MLRSLEDEIGALRRKQVHLGSVLQDEQCSVDMLTKSLQKLQNKYEKKKEKVRILILVIFNNYIQWFFIIVT